MINTLRRIEKKLKMEISLKNKTLITESLRFIPLFVIYISITLIFSQITFQGDESRYISFAENLLNGYYAKPGLKPGFLWNGPGYPIIISPFIYFKAPLIIIKLLNSVFLFIGVVFLYKSFRFKLDNKKSLILAYAAGLTHPYFFRAITLILTEALSFFLICFSLFYFLKYIQRKKLNDLVIFSFGAGLLMLTKVFFSYVFLSLGILSIFTLSFFKLKKESITYLKLSFFPFILCIPYLFYTYNITGKIFYWSDAGGSALYSMSTPYENEYGDWFPPDRRALIPVESKFVKNNRNVVKENHSDFLMSLEKLNGIEKDSKLKERALSNIKNNPLKYFKNIIYNFSRMAFRYPFTRFESLPILIIISVFHFSFLFVPLIYSILMIVSERKKQFIIPLIFFSIYLGGSLLVSSTVRFVFPVYPLIFYIISAILIEKKWNLKK